MKKNHSHRAERWAHRLSLAPLLLLGFMGVGSASQDNLIGLFIFLGIGLLGTLVAYPILCPILSLFLKSSEQSSTRKPKPPRYVSAHRWVARLSLAPLVLGGAVSVLAAVKGHPEDIVILLGLGLLFSGMAYLVFGFIASVVIGEFIWDFMRGGDEATHLWSQDQLARLDDPFDPSNINHPLHPGNLSGTTNLDSPMNPWGYAYGDDRIGSDW